MAKETIKIVEMDTNPAQTSVKDLRKQLKALKDEMANLEEGGDEFLKVANKAGELKHQLDEINESVKGASADFGDMLGNVTNVAAGLVGAFEVVAGGLQAMGVESEALDETIARMQGLMAVVQGLSAIDDGIKSLDKLRESITSTSKSAKLLRAALQPKVFLAVGAAVSALSLVFGKLFGNAKKAAEMEKERAEAFKQLKLEEQKEKQEEYNNALARELTLKEKIITAKYGSDDVTQIQELIRLYNTELNDLEAQLKNKYRDNERLAIKSRIIELNNDLKQLKEGSQAYMETLIEITTAEQELKKVQPYTEEEVANLKTRINDLKQKIKGAELDLKEAQVLKEVNDAKARAKTAKETEDAAKREAELAEERKKDYEDEARTIEYLTTLYKDLYGEDSIAFKEEELNLAERALSNIKSYFGETSEEYKTQLLLVLDLRKAYEELTKEKEEGLTQEQIELALENDRLKEMAKGWLYNEETAIETFDRISEELKLALDRDLITQTQYDTAVKNLATERSRYIADQSVKTFASAANFVTTLLDGIASQQDQTNKEGFEKSKKLQIASTTIQMLTGVATALAGAFTTKSGPWDIVLASIQAASIAASGILNINKIKNTKFDGGTTSPTVSSGAINTMIVPPVQYSNAVQGASTVGAIQNQKVYVTESDIVDTINKVNVAETENTY